MNAPNSVALISAGYPPYMAGGIDVQTYDLAHALSSSNVDVTVFCGSANTPTRVCESENLTILRLPLAEAPPRVVWFQLQNLAVFRKTLPSFDVVHTQHSSGSVYGLLKGEVRKPWVVSFHDHQLTRLKVLFDVKPWNLSLGDIAFYTVGYPIFELLTRIELRGADHYVACGKTGFRDYVRFSKMDPAKTTVIPNGIDLDKIDSMLASFARNDHTEADGSMIFTCGRLYASKGTEYLIKAMPKVLGRHKNVRLKIFGKGPLHAHLQNLVASLNLRDHVELAGHVPYDRLVREMSRSDLTVFPSLVEVGASLAVMEAMACRKAVVAFDYPFSNEIIAHSENGLLVPPKNTEALADAICALLSDEKLRKRIGENARRNIVENHDIKLTVTRYIEVYSKVMQSSGQSIL